MGGTMEAPGSSMVVVGVDTGVGGGSSRLIGGMLRGSSLRPISLTA